MSTKVIKINCEAKARVPVDDLVDLQGNLKEMTEENYQRLRESIVKYGFVAPVFVWVSKQKPHFIDGHHRIKTLRRMIKEEAFKIEGGNSVPAAYVTPRPNTRAQAIQVLLVINSRYATITDEGLYELITTAGVNFDAIKDVLRLPEVNMAAFEAGYMNDSIPEELPAVDVAGTTQGVREYLVVYFEDEEQYKKIRAELQLGALVRQIEYNDFMKELER